MNHRLIILLFTLGIVTAVVGGVVSWEWLANPGGHESPDGTADTGTSSQAARSTLDVVAGATSSVFQALPTPTAGPSALEAAVGVASAAPLIIAVNEPTDVAVTIEITDPRLLAGSVNLQRLNATGKVIAVIGTLNDAGTAGDAVAGDKTFTGRRTFTEATTTPVRLRVSWALRGVVRRQISNVLVVDVWASTSLRDVTLQYPPTWELNAAKLAASGPISLNNFHSQFDSGGLIPPGGGEIEVVTTDLSLPLSERIADDLRGALITAVTDLTVSSLPATKVIYVAHFVGSFRYNGVVVYIPTSTVLRKIFLTYNASGPMEQTILDEFDTFLTMLHFSD